MHAIRRANISDFKILAQLAKKTFIESHGHSAKEKSISNYLNKYYTEEAIKIELSNPEFIYFVLEYNKIPIGFSKITLNTNHEQIEESDLVLLDRIYVLEEHIGKKLGWELFQANLNYSKENKQNGMWLHTWVENKKAIDFYLKTGFNIIGSYDFQIDETHSNPNHTMYLKF